MEEAISQEEMIDFIETSAAALADKNEVIQKQAAEIEALKLQLSNTVKYANSLKEENEQLALTHQQSLNKIASEQANAISSKEFLTKEEAESIIGNLSTLGIMKQAAQKETAEVLLKDPRAVYGLMTVLMEKCASSSTGSNDIGRLIAASATKISIPLTSAERLEQKILNSR